MSFPSMPVPLTSLPLVLSDHFLTSTIYLYTNFSLLGLYKDPMTE